MEVLKDGILLPDNIRGRDIHSNVIPTVCSIKIMLEKLKAVNGDYSQLKQWEKRSYQAYHIDKIQDELFSLTKAEQIELIKSHILSIHPKEIGASCIDIYLVAYVAENYGTGKTTFFNYIKNNEISDKDNSANAIWQVGKGDGVYLGLLNDDGSILDWNFFAKWVKADGKKTISVPLKIWFNENTNHIHMNVAGQLTTVNNNPESKRGNPKLYRLLEEQLRLAGKIN